MNEFEEYHIDEVWKFLHQRFGFDRKKWKIKFEEFRKEHHKRNRGYSKTITNDFIYFGNTVINPILNEILCRYQQTNTFNRLVQFLLSGKNQNEN